MVFANNMETGDFILGVSVLGGVALCCCFTWFYCFVKDDENNKYVLI